MPLFLDYAYHSHPKKKTTDGFGSHQNLKRVLTKNVQLNFSMDVLQ